MSIHDMVNGKPCMLGRSPLAPHHPASCAPTTGLNVQDGKTPGDVAAAGSGVSELLALPTSALAAAAGADGAAAAGGAKRAAAAAAAGARGKKFPPEAATAAQGGRLPPLFKRAAAAAASAAASAAAPAFLNPRGAAGQRGGSCAAGGSNGLPATASPVVPGRHPSKGRAEPGGQQQRPVLAPGKAPHAGVRASTPEDGVAASSGQPGGSIRGGGAGAVRTAAFVTSVAARASKARR